MITAIDFGCYAIRSAYLSSSSPRTVRHFSERSEYAVLPNVDHYRQTLTDKAIAFAECEDSIVVFGNLAEQVRWLSRKPCAPLFADGKIPTADAPARQILSVLTQALLPKPDGGTNYCCFTCPGGSALPENSEFLSRLVRMSGFIPVECSVANAVTLATGSENQFSGVTIVIGAESSQVNVTRFGREIACDTINIGANWIDRELADQLKLRVYDDAGECYPDLAAVRDWKHDPQVHLRNGMGEREKTLSRLYGVLLNRIAKSVRTLIHSPIVRAKAPDRVSVVCAGGATQVAGFSAALTERFVDHDIASNILSVRVDESPSTAVLRGLLIQGELELKRSSGESNAA